MRSTPRMDVLGAHAARLVDRRIPELVAEDPVRAAGRALRVGPLYANFARHRLDADAWQALFGLAGDAGVPAAIRALFDGAEVNASERRPALHTALRSSLGASAVARDAHRLAGEARAQMDGLVAALAASDVTDIVNVGIGGSDLGPRLAVDALRDFHSGRFRVHFLANVDGSAAQHLLRGLDPARTAAILVSKSFGTQETLLNGAILRDWLGGGERLYAVSANVPGAKAFGVDTGRILPMWDWVGGRFSLWSAVGFAIALAVGMARFDELLAGAAEMDAHVLGAPVECNLAVWHALVAVWNRNGLGLDSHAILPYDERLALLPAYLQQLVMESLGKSVTPRGEPVDCATAPVLWGGVGTSSQHSFFQALHQGSDTVPADFIGVVRPAHGYTDNHHALLANLLAQAEALANGYAAADPQRRHPGNRPSTFLLLDALTPQALGALLALYEHSVYVQSVLWDINAFDQWGVELGKKIAGDLLPAVRDGSDAGVIDPVTRTLLAEIRARG
ncbi:glucose-6-phosphate isomerase [Rehaibacterium terrae]|jgi:glucose-6-phosphate isomerase|uniref:Glucose-6-phosphate isomerase n=1 Tax=Rehaibacterium terrae TaxID=1341696 RepID=A0A7W8DFF6_9GAMM|nr:glucose-6-phosphate isomerase [Rehaibacterium terrae]MBB5016335.1 glucose-6-phosphate isomerase [Rehaibacterium terrae]